MDHPEVCVTAGAAGVLDSHKVIMSHLGHEFSFMFSLDTPSTGSRSVTGILNFLDYIAKI